jgi:snurportin-1
MSGGAAAARRDPRALASSYQERRRAAALDAQRHARAGAAERARRLALAAAAAAEEEAAEAQPITPPHQADADAANHAATPSGARPPRRPHARVDTERGLWEGQLMLPEWLIDVPSDLGPAWLALPRPEGPRCLLVAGGGTTAARDRAGVLLERLRSGLPGGGAPGPARAGAGAVLDAVWHAPTATYYALDVLSWRGQDLGGCTAEFRLHWLRARLAELAAEQGGASDGGVAAWTVGGGGAPRARRVEPLPAYDATPAGLAAAHSAPAPFIRDGLYLLHRCAHYAPGATPLALAWKDAACSRYVVDTDPATGAPAAAQRLVLALRADGRVETGDDPPVALGAAPPAAHAGGARPGRLLRFRLGPGGVAAGPDGAPVGADLEYEGAANQRRGRADSLSRILFQRAAREAPIALEALLAAAAAGVAAGAGAGAGDGSSIGVGRAGAEAAPMDSDAG